MSVPRQSIVETRRHQMFPRLEPAEVDRLRRFGELRTYRADDQLARVGDVGLGLVVVLSGEIEVTGRDEAAQPQHIITYEAGGFMGELAQMSGRPSLVDAFARGTTEALVIVPERLRALFVGEAELGERIMRAMILRRIGLLETGAGGPIIIGRADDGDVLRLEGFLARNGHPRLRLDPATDPEAKTLIERFHIDPAHLPIVLCTNGKLLRNPGENELARCIGLVRPIDGEKLYDVAVIGAGPAGLSSAVYAASEGLSVLVLDCRSFGGQAGASSRIENYLGFPTGISGLALMARAYNQAQKFGVEMAIPDEVTRFEPPSPDDDGQFALGLANGERVRARSVVIASGARYRRLDVADLDAYEGTSVHYWASPLEAKLCAGQEVALIGAGNSAGQAVVFLAARVKKVWLLVRGPSLDASMSRYLIDRISGLPNVEIVVQAQVSALEGEDGRLEAIRVHCNGADTRCAIRHLFLFIGAVPNTDFLQGSGVQLDEKGFVCTGGDFSNPANLLETSRHGVFAVGDVRSSSVKRVATSVGEGAQVISILHKFLAERPVAEPAILTPA